MIPAAFLERLNSIIPSADMAGVLQTFSCPEMPSIRVNTLKATCDEVLSCFRAQGVSCVPVAWCPEAFTVDGVPDGALSGHPLVSEGKIYQQNLSSLIPVVLLDPQPGERILDACAAPGSKTTQIAARMNNQGELIAVESVKARFFRLRSVCTLLGAASVNCKLCDVRRFRSLDGALFDRVLVDAPCSSEGRFRADDPETVAYWSTRKIKEMSYKQKGILMSAARLLRSGGTLVYSTCTFAPEENEEVVDWFLRKNSDFVVEDTLVQGVECLPALTQWGRNAYSSDVMKCFRVRPGRSLTGFFVARFKRV